MSKISRPQTSSSSNRIPRSIMGHTHHHHHLPKHKLSIFFIFIILFIIIIQLYHNNSIITTIHDDQSDHMMMIHKLRVSTTFLPLKDLRYSHVPLQAHTWFMSSLYDTHHEGQVQFQKFPSMSSQNRILCLSGRDTHDGSWNSYALVWPEARPYNSTLMTGLTFVSYNHYNYENIWHGLSAVFPFVAWHIMNNCSVGPDRWVLYHWGELRLGMGPWLRSLMEATFDGPVNVEEFGLGDGDDHGPGPGGPVCFEEAVVMRNNEGGMWREKRMEVYDLMRCKARIYCGVGSDGGIKSRIGMTLFLRSGGRSFKNDTAVAEIFGRACEKVEGCEFMLVHSNNLTFCDQVKVMSKTDILISPHGAQLTNMFLMNRNSSVMEFFPKGWLKLAGVGQYVYHWIASWSGINHHGAWRDPHGEPCPYDDQHDRRCMSFFKNAHIGHNHTYFTHWATHVLDHQVNQKKLMEPTSSSSSPSCNCGSSL